MAKINLDTVIEVVSYFIENDSTSWKTAEHFGISHSTVLRYLRVICPNKESDKILAYNSIEYRFGGRENKVVPRKAIDSHHFKHF